MLKQLLSATKVIVLALVLSFGLSYAIAAWTPPTLPPPGANTDAPINIGATPQTKVGGDICTTVSGTTKCVQEIGSASGSGDNLGNHTATTSLNMAGFGINNAGNINATGNAIAKFGPNSTWGAYLDVGGNGRTTTNASVVATNGNLHLDARNGYNTYLNYYSGGPIIAGGYIDARPNNIYAGDVYSSTAGKWMSQIKSADNYEVINAANNVTYTRSYTGKVRVTYTSNIFVGGLQTLGWYFYFNGGVVNSWAGTVNYQVGLSPHYVHTANVAGSFSVRNYGIGFMNGQIMIEYL